MLSTNTQASLGLLGKRYVATNSQLQIYYECDTGFAERRIIEIERNNVINNDRLGMQFMNDSLLHFQVIATGGNQILDYSVSNFEIIRGVMDVKNAKILNMVIEEDDPTTFFVDNNGAYHNRRFRSPKTFNGNVLNGSANKFITHLLAYTTNLNESFSIPTTFSKPDSSLAGYINARLKLDSEFLFDGATEPSGGRVFDEYFDDVDVLVVTDTTGNKRKVFHASKATFPYLNYDGSSIYFTCDCFPNFSYVQNTPIPGFSLGKLDSSGVVEWLHKIPTKASIVQDTAYRTYIFGYLQNGEPIFGESLGDN